MGGLLSVTGLPGQGPVRVGIPIADSMWGIFARDGVTVALLERERRQRPMAAYVASGSDDLHDGFPDLSAGRSTAKSGAGGQLPPHHHSYRRLQDQRRTHTIAVFGGKIWERFAQASGGAAVDHRRASKTRANPFHASRLAHAKIERRLLRNTSNYWIATLERGGRGLAAHQHISRKWFERAAGEALGMLKRVTSTAAREQTLHGPAGHTGGAGHLEPGSRARRPAGEHSEESSPRSGLRLRGHARMKRQELF